MSNFSNFIDFSSDAVFLVSALIIFLAFAMYFGRGRLISFILAFYPASLLYKGFPFATKLLFLHGDKAEVLNHLGIFLLFWIPLSIIIERFIYSESMFSSSSNFLRNLGVATVLVILVLILNYNVINIQLLHDFSGKIDSFFTNPSYIFYWNLVPFAVLALI